MWKVRRIVDLNAYILNLKCEVKNIDQRKQLFFSFDNLNYGTIVAIRISCAAWDSFGDKVIFDGKSELEVKKSGLQIKPLKKAGFIYEIENYDIKQTEAKVTQIVYADGTKIVPDKEEIIEYEIEQLDSSWTPDSHFEKDVLDYLREKNEESICLPSLHPSGWICLCGNLNAIKHENCVKCGFSKRKALEDFTEEKLKLIVEKREAEKQEEEQRRKEERRLEIQKSDKKQKRRIILIAGIIVIALAQMIIHRVKYGLSSAERVQYEVAQENYGRVKYFVLVLWNDYYEVAEQYYDNNYDGHERESRISDAEKNKDYLYSREMYLASSWLYELIEEQYPDKYQKAYAQLVRLHKGDVYNHYSIIETKYVENGRVEELYDKKDEIDAAIEAMEKYMDNEMLNPDKVKLKSADITPTDYSIVRGIDMGILFYEDGSICYIGEFADGKANGFGRSWYPTEKGGGSLCEGTFENGYFKEGSCYDTAGDDEYAPEIKDVPVVEGDFLSIPLSAR